MARTAQELAELIIGIEHSDTDARQLARRVRHFEAERLIVAMPEKRDARGTSQFDVVEACKTRLLSVLSDFGFDKNLLSQVVRMIAPPATGVLRSGEKEEPYWEDPTAEAHHVKNLPEAIRKGEAWELVLTFNSQFGRKSVSGGFFIPSDSDRDLMEDEAASQAFRKTQEIQRYGWLMLPASYLCAPVVAAYDGQAE